MCSDAGVMTLEKQNSSRGRRWALTCTQVRLAASTQDGIKLWLIGSHFILPGCIQFLWCANADAQRPRLESRSMIRLCDIKGKAPEHPVAPGRCPQSLVRHGSPTGRQGWSFSFEAIAPGFKDQRWNVQQLPGRERPGVSGSVRRCRWWWHPPVFSRTLEIMCLEVRVKTYHHLPDRLLPGEQYKTWWNVFNQRWAN